MSSCNQATEINTIIHEGLTICILSAHDDRDKVQNHLWQGSVLRNQSEEFQKLISINNLQLVAIIEISWTTRARACPRRLPRTTANRQTVR